MVGVLILINQNVLELLLVLRSNVWERPEQVNGFANEVVKVKGVIFAQLVLVSGEDFRDYASNRVILINIASIRLGIGEFVLGI